MKQTKILLLFLLITALQRIDAQVRLDKIEVNGWYIGTMDQVLEKISKEKGVVFKYDKVKAQKIKIDCPPFQRTLESFIKNMICNGNKLKYYISDDGVIYIIDQWEKLASNEVKKEVAYHGNAEKANFAFSGTVVDKESHESLPYVNVRVKNSKNVTTTNVDGYFTLLKVPTDTSTLVVSYIGYKPKEIHLTPNTPVHHAVFELEANTELLSEVVVMADKQDLLQTNEKVGMIKMTPLKMSILPSLGEKDIFRTFQLMPGISAANENSSGLYVRGGTPDQSLVLYDGIPIYNVQHLFGFFSAFNSNAIKDIQLYKGGFDAKYGGRLSSVVEITGKEGNQKKFGAMVDVSLMSANAYLEFPLGKNLTFLFAGRHSWQSPLYDLIYKQSTTSSSGSMAPPKHDGGGPGGGHAPNETNATSYFYDTNSKITWRPSSKDILSFSTYNGKDYLDNAFSPGGMGGPPPGKSSITSMSMTNTDNTQWGNTGISLKWSRNWSNRLYSNALISYSDYVNDRDRTNEGSYYTSSGTYVEFTKGYVEHNGIRDLSQKIDFEYKLSNKQLLSFGFDHTTNDVRYSYVQNDTLTVLSKKNRTNLTSGYLQDKITLLKNRLELNPGLRYTNYDVTGKNYFEPRFSGSYKVNNQLKLKGSLGRYYQFAKKVTREDVMQGDREFWMMADGTQMPVSSSNLAVAGFAYETKNYLFDVEAYYKKLKDISEYSIRFDQQGGGFGPDAETTTSLSDDINYETKFFTGTGYSKGIDFLLQKKYGNYTGWMGYTISETVNHFPDFGNYDFYASNDVTHEFKIVNTYKWHNWDFALNWIFASGKPYTRPEGVYEVTLPDGSTKEYFNATVKNGCRLPDYHRMDVAATYNFKLSQKYPCTVNFSIFNLYNRTNIWYKEFQIVNSEVVETNVNYLGILPNVNFSIKF
ncbi:TonB-dependent receptor [Parabacteroides sp. FAFU027]|uniref:TonB-dependent receptor n=1 Tax=Parabacteroides sp. FAFU027 TaxID=2922715 RepID=UPI001FB0498D|nr:TonB-dependent receptor [Parabacteroides sp. FAFU027]